MLLVEHLHGVAAGRLQTPTSGHLLHAHTAAITLHPGGAAGGAPAWRRCWQAANTNVWHGAIVLQQVVVLPYMHSVGWRLGSGVLLPCVVLTKALSPVLVDPGARLASHHVSTTDAPPFALQPGVQ